MNAADAKQTDEQLVVRYQTEQCQLSFSELYERYSNMLQSRARSAARKYAGQIDESTFTAKFDDQFIVAVRKYDATLGTPFAAFLQLKLAGAVYDVLRATIYKSHRDDAENFVERHPQIVSGDKLHAEQYGEPVTLLDTVVDDTATYEHSQTAQSTDLYTYLQRCSHIDAQALLLKDAGFTYEEIAQRLGRTGSPVTLRNWTKRCFERLQRYVSAYMENPPSNVCPTGSHVVNTTQRVHPPIAAQLDWQI